MVTELLRELTPIEAKYVIKMITGDLRIGLKENTVEEAIAKALNVLPTAVRRTNMALGDIGETAVLASHGHLEHVSLRLLPSSQVHACHARRERRRNLREFHGPVSSRTNTTGFAANCIRAENAGTVFADAR